MAGVKLFQLRFWRVLPIDVAPHLQHIFLTGFRAGLGGATPLLAAKE